MKNLKKYVVYHVDNVNENCEVFTSDSLDECKEWISGTGNMKVDDEHPCSDSVFYSSKVFCYEVYDNENDPMLSKNGSEYESDWTFGEPVFTSDNYYAD